MRRLGKLWQALKLVSAARELAAESRQLEWTVSLPNTVFLQAEHCDITLAWQEDARVIARMELPVGFGWLWTSDQDEAGVYLIAQRKALIGGMARGRIALSLPRGIHISLKLASCQLCCQGLDASLEWPPFQADAPSQIIPS